MDIVNPRHCKCREEEQAAETAAAKQEAKRRKKAKEQVKAQQAKLATGASPADHSAAPSQLANGPSNAAYAATVRSESPSSHDTRAISPQAPSQVTGQQQHEPEAMQLNGKELASPQAEAQLDAAGQATAPRNDEMHPVRTADWESQSAERSLPKQAQLAGSAADSGTFQAGLSKSISSDHLEKADHAAAGSTCSLRELPAESQAGRDNRRYLQVRQQPGI